MVNCNFFLSFLESFIKLNIYLSKIIAIIHLILTNQATLIYLKCSIYCLKTFCEQKLQKELLYLLTIIQC